MRSTFRLSAGTGALCVLLVLLPRSPAQDPAAIGDPVPDHTFTNSLGHDGRTRLGDYIGHPVLVVGWKTHLVDGLHAAREAHQLGEKYARKGLITIMTDRHGWNSASAASGAAGFWMTVTGGIPFLASSPVTNPKTDLPIAWTVPRDERSAALIGVDGRLLAVGTMEEIRAKPKPTDFRAQLRKLIAEEMKRRASGWGEDPAAKQARGLAFGDGQLGKALALLQTSDAPPPEHAAARAEIERHYRARRDSVGYLVEQGRPLEAKEAAAALAKAVKGHDAWTQEVETLVASFATAEHKRELGLDRTLQRIIRPLLGQPPKGKVSVKIIVDLRRFAEVYGDTKVGARAARLDGLVHDQLASRLGMRHKELEARIEKESPSRSR